MFRGQYNHTIDAKGRLIIPVKYREQLGDTFICTKGFDKCLYLYPLAEWQNVEDRFGEINSTSKKPENWPVSSLEVHRNANLTNRGVC